jgi:hypothetical protein
MFDEFANRTCGKIRHGHGRRVGIVNYKQESSRITTVGQRGHAFLAWRAVAWPRCYADTLASVLFTGAKLAAENRDHQWWPVPYPRPCAG